jgi:glycosyltransferase involved in cell wall biosynthesis
MGTEGLKPGVSVDSYVLVTPVRDEERTIGITLESVVQQTIRPVEWVIVSDGSVDRTEEIVRGYAARYSFVRLIVRPKQDQRSFSSVVDTMQIGLESLRATSHQYVGFLDADIRLDCNYYSDILQRFEEDPMLGLAGGLVLDVIHGRRVRGTQSLSEVAGAVQFFRKRCFNALGGLTAVPEGGWDALTCVQARMKGFRTRTFAELEVDHLKPRNASEGSIPRRHFYLGARDYALGNHALFETVKCLYRCFEYPWIIGGAARWFGFFWSWIKRRRRVIPDQLISYIREEQIGRLLGWRPKPGVRGN